MHAVSAAINHTYTMDPIPVRHNLSRPTLGLPDLGLVTRLLLAITALESLEMAQLDAIHIFLNSKLTELAHAMHPTGFQIKAFAVAQ